MAANNAFQQLGEGAGRLGEMKIEETRTSQMGCPLYGRVANNATTCTNKNWRNTSRRYI